MERCLGFLTAMAGLIGPASGPLRVTASRVAARSAEREPSHTRPDLPASSSAFGAPARKNVWDSLGEVVPRAHGRLLRAAAGAELVKSSRPGEDDDRSRVIGARVPRCMLARHTVYA